MELSAAIAKPPPEDPAVDFGAFGVQFVPEQVHGFGV